MDTTRVAAMYLSQIAVAVSRLSWMVTYSTEGIEKLPTIIVTMLELEQSTADFFEEMGLDSELHTDMSACRNFFLRANEDVIAHIEKLQLQSENLAELSTALKLENEVIRKELHLS